MNKTNKFFLLVFFILLIIIIFNILKITPLDPDTYWHLSSGKEIIKYKFLPSVDNFYYSGSGYWYVHEWLFDILLYLISIIIGVNNLFYINFLIWIIILFEIFLIIKLKADLNDLPVFLPFLLIIIYLLMPFVVLRPQVFTYIFLLYFIFVLSHIPVKKNNLLYYSLPFLTIVWVNFHSGTIIGIFLVFVYYIYYAIKKIKDNIKDYNLWMIFLNLVGDIIASFINPLGFKSFFIFSKDKIIFLQKHILDWQPIWQIQSKSELIIFMIFCFYASINFIILFYNLKIIDKEKQLELLKNIFLNLVFFISAVFFRRNIAIFLIVSLPCIIYYIDMIFKHRTVLFNKWDIIKVQNFYNKILIILILLLSSFVFYINNYSVKSYYPTNSIKYIIENKPPKNIFADMLWNGFLEYYLYPDYKVMLNGRFNCDLQVMRDYFCILNARDNFLEKIKQYNIKSFLLDYNSILIKKLINFDYKITYFDDNCVILVDKNNAKKYFKYINPFNDNFYDKINYKNALSEIKQFISKYPSEKVLLMYALILSEKEVENAINFLEKSIKEYKNYYSLYNLLATIYFNKKDFQKSYKILKMTKKRTPYINLLIKEIKKELNKE
jgi:hypothetical protein